MPAKNPPQSLAQMLEQEQQRRTGSKLYREQSATFIDGQIADMVSETAVQLEQAAHMEPISLSNIDAVVSTTMNYVHACAEASTIPSIVGLARSLGVSRQAIYDTINRDSPKQAARWFSIVRDSFSEMLGNASLRNGVNSIVSIFLLKSLYGYKETNEFIIQNGQAQTLTDEDRQEMAAQLMSKYGDIPDD